MKTKRSSFTKDGNGTLTFGNGLDLPALKNCTFDEGTTLLTNGTLGSDTTRNAIMVSSSSSTSGALRQSGGRIAADYGGNNDSYVMFLVGSGGRWGYYELSEGTMVLSYLGRRPPGGVGSDAMYPSDPAFPKAYDPRYQP